MDRYFIKVELVEEEKKIKVFSIKSPSNSDAMLDFFQEHVENIIDIVNMHVYDYENDIAVVVDDEGLLKVGNIVYEIKFKEQKIQLAGTLLIGKNEMREDGLYTVGFTSEELRDIHNNKHIVVKAIGETL